MADVLRVNVLRLAMDRRETLQREVSEIDRFIRTAERIIRSHGSRDTTSGADAFQFNTGEVQPPTAGRSEAG